MTWHLPSPDFQPSFGWIPPTPKKRAENYRYLLLPSFGWEAPEPGAVEVSLPYPDTDRFIRGYDQNGCGSCVGFSFSWATTINNRSDIGAPHLYDAYWLYAQAQKVDGDPRTNGCNDGTYPFAAGDVLRDKGHRLMGETTPKLEYGIESYYWVTKVGGFRTALYNYRPVLLGIPWHEQFMRPVEFQGKPWIALDGSWGKIKGGHMICSPVASDSQRCPNGEYGAFMLLNTWGEQYPPVWLPYSSIERFMNEGAEMCVMMDRNPIPPAPVSPSPSSSPSPSPTPSPTPSPSPSPTPSPSPSPSPELPLKDVSVTIGGVQYGPGDLPRIR